MEVKSKIIIDRSDPHEVICITPDGRKLTRLECLREGGVLRTDIALINVEETCPCCGQKVLKQYCVYASPTGPCGEGLKFLDENELHQVEEICRKLAEISKIYPEMSYYLKVRA